MTKTLKFTIDTIDNGYLLSYYADPEHYTVTWDGTFDGKLYCSDMEQAKFKMINSFLNLSRASLSVNPTCRPG